MSARKLVYQSMAISPIFLTAAIGFHARSANNNYIPPNGFHQQEMINAYVPVVREVEHHVREDNRVPIEVARRLAQEWIDRSARGEFQPLTPAFYEDSVQQGVKADIIRAKTKIVFSLIQHAAASVDGSVTMNAKDLLLAMKLSETLKYSDFASIYTCGAEQRHAMEMMKPLLAGLDKGTAHEVVAELQGLRSKDEKVNTLVLLTRRQYAESRKRKGEDPVPLEESQKLVAFSNRLLDTGSDPVMHETHASPMLASTEIPGYFTSLRLAMSTMRANDQTIDSVIKTLSPQS